MTARVVAGRVLLDEEPLDLAVGGVARPDHDHVGDGAVADPALLAVEDVAVAVAAAVVSSATASEPCSGSVSANAPSRSSRAIPGSQRCFCSSEPEHPDRPHRQPGLHGVERAEAAVTPVQLHVDQSGGDRAHRWAAVALDAVADDAERAHLLDELPRELRPFPVAVDDGQHLGVDERPGALQVVPLGIGQLVAQAEVVGAQRPADRGGGEHVLVVGLVGQHLGVHGVGTHPWIRLLCPAHSFSRSSNFCGFPVAVRGSWSTNSTAFGTL